MINVASGWPVRSLVGLCLDHVQGLAKTLLRRTTAKKITNEQSNLSDAQLPAFAISLAISLATEARSYSDLALRPRVMARAADVLWDADNLTARELFKRAWDEAEKGDADEVAH